MKIINYLYNVLRLGIMKAKKNYNGSILQGIPYSTVIFSGSGLLSLKGRLSSRSNSFLNACDGKLTIGKNCFVNQNAYIVSKEMITIGDNVIIGPNVVIVDHDHDFRGDDFMHEFITSPIVVEDNVWIGGNVTILKGVTIGHDSVIGAGCVLNRKNTGCIPPHSLVYLDDGLCIKPIEKRSEIKNECKNRLMGETMELVSVIITTCHGTEKLVRAIRSVLNQTYKHLEIIVVDDNGRGTKNQLYTESIIDSFLEENQIRYIVHDVNKNGAVARNTGAAVANGEYLAFLDDDDFYLPSRIELFIKKVKTAKSELVYSDVLFLKNGLIINGMQARTAGFTYKDLLMDQSLLGTGSNIFVSKAVYDKISGFDESFKRYQDVEFVIRALEIGRIVGVNEYTVVKDISEVRFYPQYDKFLSAQNHFLERFYVEIDELDAQERRYCVLSKRRELYNAACMSKNQDNIKDAIQWIRRSISDLTFKENIKMRVRGIYMGYCYGILAPVRTLKQINQVRRLQRELSVQTKSEIQNIL